MRLSLTLTSLFLLFADGYYSACHAITSAQHVFHEYEHADVIYEHAFDIRGKHKKMSLKFILLSVEGRDKLVIFQNYPVKKSGPAWYWSQLNLKHPASYDPTTSSQPLLTPVTEILHQQNPSVSEKDAISSQDSIVVESLQRAIDPVLIEANEARPSPGILKEINEVKDINQFNFRVVVPGDRVDLVSMKSTMGTANSALLPFKYSTADPKKHGYDISIKTRSEYQGSLPSHISDMYSDAASWILANYAANNTTADAKAGTEVIGIALLDAIINNDRSDRSQDWVEFTPCYFAFGKDQNVTISHSFDPVGLRNDLKFNVDFIAAWYYLDCPDYEQAVWQNAAAAAAVDAKKRAKMAATKPSATVLPSSGPTATPTAATPPLAGAPAPAAAAPDANAPPLPEFAYTVPLPSFPSFNYDSSGVSASTGLVLKPTRGKKPDKPVNPDTNALDPDYPSISLSGGKYFTQSYYNVALSPQWTFTFDNDSSTGPGSAQPAGSTHPGAIAPVVPPAANSIGLDQVTAGPQFTRKLQANGVTATKTTTTGMATLGIKGSDSDSSFAYAMDENSGIEVDTNNANGVNTDEYTSTSHAMQTWYLCPDAVPKKDNQTPVKPPDSSKAPLPPNELIAMEFDVNEWIKPAELTQNSHFDTTAAARFHYGADIPAPLTHSFFRIDASLTGGGAMGAPPDTDRFYGGNTDGTVSSAVVLPTPVIRSFGTGKLGLFADPNYHGPKMAGADSYANANLTVAFPCVFPPVQFIDSAEKSHLEGKFSANNTDSNDVQLADDSANQDQINFLVNYDDKFSLRPLFTCDAAWMGAPTNYQDRNLICVGGGAEFSCAVINLDVLYEVTLHDTAASQQALSENIIAQISYDIHF